MTREDIENTKNAYFNMYTITAALFNTTEAEEKAKQTLDAAKLNNAYALYLYHEVVKETGTPISDIDERIDSYKSAFDELLKSTEYDAREEAAESMCNTLPKPYCMNVREVYNVADDECW